MPKRSDLRRILIIGAGPITIGQGCEFDYSGTQAVKVLKEEGYEVVLVNSNPATIMTDPHLADATYVEPIHEATLERIIERERPDALLPTMGGQTALNLALHLSRTGVLKRYGVQLIGAQEQAIEKAEDRGLFRTAMEGIGLKMPHSWLVHSFEAAVEAQKDVGFPTIIRPSFTLGGSGGGIAYNLEEFECIVRRGLSLSSNHSVLIETSIMGWKEYEMEVVRDRKDNAIIVCTIENMDPMGVHTGDSITVAPAQTLTDKEHQKMRDAALAVLRTIGVETGGANVQFAVNPATGEQVVIEMNPRVSRSSALASKATGFPIARVAAQLAVGYTLDELRHELTQGAVPASFEPALDYVVVKIPRFNFDKFPNSDPTLGTQMHAVGESMAMGVHFQEAFMKALRALECGYHGLESRLATLQEPKTELLQRLKRPSPERVFFVADAFRVGMPLEEVHAHTGIDPWFLSHIQAWVVEESALRQKQGTPPEEVGAQQWRHWKQQGFADEVLARCLGASVLEVRQARVACGVRAVFKRVDTCAAEFPTQTAYLYSTYDQHCEASSDPQKRPVMILGSGPNRIGQGIEFDYCCVQAAHALRDLGYATLMVNCNPETVSTDFDVADKLYFEPLDEESVLNIIDVEAPQGVLVQLGGQTPLKLARCVMQAGVSVLGTSYEAIALSEDREQFQALMTQWGIDQPPNGTARTLWEAEALVARLGFPLMARPSFVLGGQGMEVLYHRDDLKRYFEEMLKTPEVLPIQLDRYLEGAVEVDVDALCDGTDVVVAGILEHIEQAGVHSGDSACAIPPFGLSQAHQTRIQAIMKRLGVALGVRGLMNAQFAVHGDHIDVLEVNPRASRTLPFVSKARGLPFLRYAVGCMMGAHLKSMKVPAYAPPTSYSVKHAVFPFLKFAGADPILGPQMRSTGEVMSTGETFAKAFAKSALASGCDLFDLKPGDTIFLSVRDADKSALVGVAQNLVRLGFSLVATRGTWLHLVQAGVGCACVNKVAEGQPHVVDHIKNGTIAWVINTTEGKQAILDSRTIRCSALEAGIGCMTTIAAAKALCAALEEGASLQVFSLQSFVQSF